MQPTILSKIGCAVLLVMVPIAVSRRLLENQEAEGGDDDGVEQCLRETAAFVELVEELKGVGDVPGEDHGAFSVPHGSQY